MSKREKWRRRKKTYNIKVYHCKRCGHIFHTTKTGLEWCDKCKVGRLEIIDRYKSPRPPRASGKRGDWVMKDRDVRPPR